MQVELRVERVERRLSLDDISDAEWLRTESATTDDGRLHIVKSWRYSDEDIAKYGAAQVSAWIVEDHRRLAEFGRDWWFVHLEAVAVVGVYAGETRIGEVEVRSLGIGGVESDADRSHFDDLSAEELSQLRDELQGYGLAMPADDDIPYVCSESWLVTEWQCGREGLRCPA
ncbi:MAG: hypothetical protein ABFE07_17815 [Armatimonadia bacterium]